MHENTQTIDNPVMAGDARQLIIGIWCGVESDPRETIEFAANGGVSMMICGGLYTLTGVYRFISDDVVTIYWGVGIGDEAEQVINMLNERLADLPGAPQVRAVQTTNWQVTLTETELHTLHLEKGRIGDFRRVG